MTMSPTLGDSESQHQQQNQPSSEARIKAVEELLVKLTAANESVTQDRDREAKKARLLEKELLSLRSSTEELRKFQELLYKGDGGANNSSSSEGLINEVNSKNSEIAALKREIDNLRSRDIPASTGTTSAEVNALRQQISDLQTKLADNENSSNLVNELRHQLAESRNVNGENRTVVVENTEHIEKLRQSIKTQHDEIMRLRETLVNERGKQGTVEVVVQDKFIELPTVEVRTVEVENVDKITVLINKCRELEQEVKKKESMIADWEAKCARLEQQPAKVVPSVVEVEDSKKIRELIEKLNTSQVEIAGLKKQIMELQNNPKIQIEYVDREVYIEVPQVEIQHVHVENPETVENHKRIVLLKDQEIQRLQQDVGYHRDQARRLERSLQEHSTLLQHSSSNQRLPGTQQHLITAGNETGLLPRNPTQVLQAHGNSPVDAKLNEFLKSMSPRLPIIHRAEKPLQSQLDLSTEFCARYYFGTLLVEMRYILQSQDLVVKGLFAEAPSQPINFKDFVAIYAEQEIRKQPGFFSGGGSRPQSAQQLNNSPSKGAISGTAQMYSGGGVPNNTNNNQQQYYSTSKEYLAANQNLSYATGYTTTGVGVGGIPATSGTGRGLAYPNNDNSISDSQNNNNSNGIDGLMAWVLGTQPLGDTGGQRNFH